MNLVRLTGVDDSSSGGSVWLTSPVLYGGSSNNDGWMLSFLEDGAEPEFSVVIRRGTTRLERKAKTVLKRLGVEATVLNTYGERYKYLPPIYREKLCAVFDLRIVGVIRPCAYVGGVMAGLSDERARAIVGSIGGDIYGLSRE